MGETWKQELAHCITDATGLAQYIRLTDVQVATLGRIIERYPMAITRYYLSLVDADDPEDPIRKMCIPSLDESSYGGQADTSGEADNTVLPGLQHKYRQTALILSTQVCAMYCRHCFRKRLVGVSTDETLDTLPPIIRYIKEHEQINNVLVSGGDAFLNDTPVIAQYLEGLSQIGHLDLIRFGTRTPVVFPQRITQDPQLLQLLKTYNLRKQLYVVTQFNHPKEITPAATEAIRKLLECGVVVKNQTVLLRGVNDDPAVLAALLKGLTAIGVVPYYVFQCRPVSGVKNQFQVPFSRGYDIVRGAMAAQNGQGKCIRYCLSHPRGKIEILGREGERMLFRFHQAKDPSEIGRIFPVKLHEDQAWLDANLQ